MAKLVLLACLLIVTLIPCLAVGQEEDGKKRQKKGSAAGAAQILNQLREVGLTDEQVAKVKELNKAANAKTAAVREKAGITPEIIKKRTEIQKKVRESGKKGSEVADLVNREAGLNEAQVKAMKEISGIRLSLRKSVVALLTKEQKDKLPKEFSRGMQGKADQAKEKAEGKKKKKEEN